MVNLLIPSKYLTFNLSVFFCILSYFLRCTFSLNMSSYKNADEYFFCGVSLKELVHGVSPILHFTFPNDITQVNFPTMTEEEYVYTYSKDITNDVTFKCIYSKSKLCDYKDGHPAVTIQNGIFLKFIRFMDGNVCIPSGQPSHVELCNDRLKRISYDQEKTSDLQLPTHINFNMDEISKISFLVPSSAYTSVKLDHQKLDDQLSIEKINGEYKVRFKFYQTDGQQTRKYLLSCLRKSCLNRLADAIEEHQEDEMTEKLGSMYSGFMFNEDLTCRLKIMLKNDKLCYSIHYHHDRSIRLWKCDIDIFLTLESIGSFYKEFYPNGNIKTNKYFTDVHSNFTVEQWLPNGDLSNILFKTYIGNGLSKSRFSEEHQFTSYNSSENSDDIIYSITRDTEARTKISPPLPHIERVFNNKYEISWFGSNHVFPDFKKFDSSNLVDFQEIIEITPNGRIVTVRNGNEKTISTQIYMKDNIYKEFMCEQYVDDKKHGPTAVVERDTTTFNILKTQSFNNGSLVQTFCYNNLGICTHIEKNEQSYSICTICCIEPAKHVTFCGHIYCISCLRKVKRCPTCRRKVKRYRLYYPV